MGESCLQEILVNEDVKLVGFENYRHIKKILNLYHQKRFITDSFVFESVSNRLSWARSLQIEPSEGFLKCLSKF